MNCERSCCRQPEIFCYWMFVHVVMSLFVSFFCQSWRSVSSIALIVASRTFRIYALSTCNLKSDALSPRSETLRHVIRALCTCMRTGGVRRGGTNVHVHRCSSRHHAHIAFSSLKEGFHTLRPEYPAPVSINFRLFKPVRLPQEFSLLQCPSL